MFDTPRHRCMVGLLSVIGCIQSACSILLRLTSRGMDKHVQSNTIIRQQLGGSCNVTHIASAEQWRCAIRKCTLALLRLQYQADLEGSTRECQAAHGQKPFQCMLHRIIHWISSFSCTYSWYICLVVLVHSYRSTQALPWQPVLCHATDSVTTIPVSLGIFHPLCLTFCLCCFIVLPALLQQSVHMFSYSPPATGPQRVFKQRRASHRNPHDRLNGTLFSSPMFTVDNVPPHLPAHASAGC